MGRKSRIDTDILKELVITEFRAKYKSQYFGYLWSVINPLIILSTLYIVFSYIVKIDIQNYQLFLLIGIIIWNFFADAADMSLNSLQDKESFIKKLNLTPMYYIISSIISSFLNLMINLAIFFLLMFIFKVRIMLSSLLLGIIFLAMLVICASGIVLIITGLYVSIRDVKHIWNAISYIWFWLTPIFYSETRIPPDIRRFYMLNPLARIINHFRDAFIYDFISSPDQIVITLIICVSLALIGLFVYKKQENKFAEEL